MWPDLSIDGPQRPVDSIGISAMKETSRVRPYYARSIYRLASGLFGLFLVGVGVFVLMRATTTAAIRVSGGLVLVLLGGNMVLSSCRGKESWLSRLGPLP
jgi:small neutral amino acid transporter SnatA (MarC family)